MVVLVDDELVKWSKQRLVKWRRIQRLARIVQRIKRIGVVKVECSKREGEIQCIWYTTECMNANVPTNIKKACNGKLPRSNEFVPEVVSDKSPKMIKRYKGVPVIYIVLATLIASVYGWFIPKPITHLSGLWMLTLVLFVGFIAMVIAHELLHGILFKIYTGKVTFGFLPKKLAFYASSPQSILTREHFILICLFPQLLALPCFLIAQVSHTPLIVYTVTTLLVLNFLGGVSDWWVALTLAHYREKIMVEDTLEGMIVYKQELS